MTDGKKTLRDFAHAFFAACQTPCVVKAYAFPDLIAGLNAHDGTHLLDALKDCGYQLVFSTTESAVFAEHEKEDGALDLSYSIGAPIRQNGVVQSVSWQSPAFNAGLVPGAFAISRVAGIPCVHASMSLTPPWCVCRDACVCHNSRTFFSA